MYPQTLYRTSASTLEDLEEGPCSGLSTPTTGGHLQSSKASHKYSKGGSWLHYFIATFCFLTTLGLLIVATINAGPHEVSTIRLASETDVLGPNEDILRSPCGSTPAQAKALGCNFDIISFCWLPDRCYDAELSSSFEKLAQWEWYMDHNRTKPVPKTEALTGNFDGLYVSWEYHIQHCVYMWEKMHRALLGEGKRAVDGYIGPYSHTEHCGNMLLSRGKGFELTNFNTRIRVKYPDCGIE